MSARLLIVGTGLIGTSIGLALADPDQVALSDADPVHLAAAVSRGAGRPWDGGRVQHAVLAVPPHRIAAVLQQLQDQDAAATYSHVASAQAHVQAEVQTGGGQTTSLCGSHPMAGREQSGPQAAVAELFQGRPWALCPSRDTSARALAATRGLALDCGSEPVVLSAEDHDAAVALVSHLPQLAASAVAAVLLGAPLGPGGRDPVRLAGPGLQDTTRVAASDPTLWLQVLSQNAAAVAPLVRALSAELDVAACALDLLAGPGMGSDAGLGMGSHAGSDADRGQAQAAVLDLLERGRAGRTRVPLKRGEHAAAFAPVAIAVPDRPGQLAGVLVSAAEAGVNVEDVRVEHLAGRPRGVIELLVHAGEQARAREALAAAGWEVLG